LLQLALINEAQARSLHRTQNCARCMTRRHHANEMIARAFFSAKMKLCQRRPSAALWVLSDYRHCGEQHTVRPCGRVPAIHRAL